MCTLLMFIIACRSTDLQNTILEIQTDLEDFLSWIDRAEGVVREPLHPDDCEQLTGVLQRAQVRHTYVFYSVTG